MPSPDSYFQAGRVKAAASLGVPSEALLRTLKGPYGDFATRLPTHMLTGSLTGGALGLLSDQPERGALLGMMAGIPTAAAIAGAPALRQKIIQRLQRSATKTSEQRGITINHRKGPFGEIHKRMAEATRIKTPKLDVSAQIQRLFKNPFGVKSLQGGVGALRA
jgi:hypothetical protein